ncbi:hypothetical protein [uncultured Rhodoferax sp.]|uniref:hypothetical protein n=1 Tax=uncultured Rhodoferax sp. TaxID=223188 RepID=UPI0025F1BFB0|nr:hypothetical protein [uncultured Rhodoferax sp.]
MRSTPLPADCLKAKQCLSNTGDCACDAAVSADQSPLLPLSAFDHFCIWGVVLCCSMALIYFTTWLGQWIAHSGVLERIDSIAARLLELVPYLPGLPYF